MRTIYIDSNFKCHLQNDGAMTAVEVDFFDNKCDTFVEGYRIVPEGQTWTREDGEVFQGEMITPWKDYQQLASAQKEFEALQEDLTASYHEGINSI